MSGVHLTSAICHLPSALKPTALYLIQLRNAIAQAGIVAHQAQGANVYYQVSNPFIFELCELVCNSLTLQLKERNQQLEQLRSISKSF